MAARAPAAQPAAPAAAPAAVQPEGQTDDHFASTPGLWLPRMVVKEHRRKATIIWVTLLVGFLAYVYYIVAETIESRKDPAVSIELKQEPFKFPDVAICPTWNEGCQGNTNCVGLAPSVYELDGFEDDYDTFMEDNASAGTDFVAANPNCRVVPLSRATINQTAIDEGDISAFHASFFMLWDEEADEDDASFGLLSNQQVSLSFVDLSKDTGVPIEDAKLPYSRIPFEAGAEFQADLNHMVLSLTEFTGIDANGQQTERQQTYSQSTTTAPQNWRWEEDTGGTFAFLVVEMVIGKFEYTSFEQVDPVDIWAILGAIGGIWQFVVTGFWLFFVFSEKQYPDRKIRNFRKTMRKPYVEANRRLSTMSSAHSRGSNTDVVIDASDEDLPAEWVKKRRSNGSIYYFNAMDGRIQDRSPNEYDSAPGALPPQRQSVLQRMWQPYNAPGQAPGSGASSGAFQSSGRQPSLDDSLPPGWVSRTDSSGKPYYMNTVDKTTQWNRPTQRPHSTGGGRGGRPQSIDAPIAHMRRGSNASSVHSHHSASSGALPHHNVPAPDARAPAPPLGTTPAAPSYNTAVFLSNNSAAVAAPGAHAGEKLPPNWQRRTTAENKTYYANNVTKETQWEAPKS